MSREENNRSDSKATGKRGRPRLVPDALLRDQIVQAAMSAFIAQGFAKTTTTDVARMAHVSKRDLYRLFTDKTELFAAVVTSRRHLIIALPRPDDEHLPVLETLRLIFRLDLDERDADERDAMLNLIARESLFLPELNALLYDTGIIQSRELLTAWLEAQMALGTLPQCDAPQVAGLLMDVVFGALLPHRQRRGPVDRDAQARDIMSRLAIVLAGLEQVSPQSRR